MPRQTTNNKNKNKSSSSSPIATNNNRKNKNKQQQTMNTILQTTLQKTPGLATQEFDDGVEHVNDEDLNTDPDVWQPYQLEWFKIVNRQDMKFFIGYFIAFGIFVVVCQPIDNLTFNKGRFMSALSRVIWTGIFALFAAIVLYIDIGLATPPRRKDRKWTCLISGYGGHFTYLTVNIITVQAYYWILCFITELIWWYLSEQQQQRQLQLRHGSLQWWIGKSITATYSFAVLSSTLGTILTLLFLKFNWYEPAWRKDTLEMYLKRGNIYFQHKILFTHIPQFPIAFFDLIVLKQTHGILESCTPSLPLLLILCVVYSASYVVFTHLNYNKTPGNLYPYPFLDVVYKTWKSEMIFYTVLTLFTFMICAFYWVVASQADMLETMVFG
jgi:hypothetical protein